jgi:hypothetical protein
MFSKTAKIRQAEAGPFCCRGICTVVLLPSRTVGG